MKRRGEIILATVAALACSTAFGQAQTAADFSATFRVQPQLEYANDDGMLSRANDLLQANSDRLTTELEMRARYAMFNGIVTWRHNSIEHAEDSDDLIVNELFANHQLGGWYFTLGKKIMSWDVGYAFRPLDVVQQEDRRRLITTTLEGVPLLAAEKFGESSAWTIVIANPQESRSTLGHDEPAVAVRGYWRVGPADVYAVAREGSSTGWRAGAAIAYVASEGFEWHASVLRARHLTQFAPTQTAFGIPLGYDVIRADAGWQALAGFSWTNESKISVLVEAWHDDRAWDNGQWRTWKGSLATVASLPIPADSRVGLTAGAAEALGTPNLRRDNIVARISRTGEKFSPSADVLYTPEDGGLIATARLNWTGNRVNAEVGWREALGATHSIARQLPFERILYASIDVSF